MLSIDELPWHGLRPGITKVYTLPESLFLGQWEIPAKTVIKMRVGNNFGYVVLYAGTKDAAGRVVPQTIFSY